MTHEELYQYMDGHSLAVLATVSPDKSPEAALVGVVATPSFHLFFDTLGTSRKSQNLRQTPKVAFVISDNETTLQYEGIADEPKGEALVHYIDAYFKKFPEGPDRAAWPDIAYFRVKPVWIRFSDYSVVPAKIVEFTFPPSE